MAKDANILVENGEYLYLSKELAQRLLTRMGLVKRKGPLQPKLRLKLFDRLKEQFLADIEAISIVFLKTW